MKNCRVLNLLFALVALTYPLSGVAQNRPFFVGVGFGQTEYQSDGLVETGILPGQTLTDDSDFEKIYFGYWVTDWFSLDVGYTDFGSASTVYRTDPRVFVTPNNHETVDVDAITVSASFEYPLFDQLRLSGALSYARFDFDQHATGGASTYSMRTTDNGFSYSLGIRYLATARFSVSVLLEASEAANRDLESVGIYFAVGI